MGILYIGSQQVMPFVNTKSTITATNQSGNAINQGDKVWLNGTNIISPTEYRYNNFVIKNGVHVDYNGVVSNFSSSNYLSILNPFNIGTQDFEIVIACMVTSGSSTYVLAGTANSTIALNPRGTSYLSTGGGTYNVALSQTTSINLNQKVWMKITRVGSTFTRYSSLDGSTWTTESTATNASSLNAMYLNIGYYGYESGSFIGNVYLDECYIKVGNDFWWQPKSLYSLRSLDLYGGLDISYGGGQVYGFSVTNYIKTPQNFTPSNNTWEMVISFLLISSSNRNIINTVYSGNFGTNFIYQSGTSLYAYLSSNGTSWDIANGANVISGLSLNTEYRVKIEFTGTAYNWYLWENNDWTLKYTLTSSSAVYGGVPITFGSDTQYGQYAFDGVINLAETYVKIDDAMWWQPYQENLNSQITVDSSTGIAEEEIAVSANGKVGIA